MQDKALTGYPSIDKPWIKSYPNVKYSSYNPDFCKMTAVDMITPKMKSSPNKVAYNFYGKLINNRTVLENISIAANAYKNLGVKKDDIVFVMGINTPEIIYTLYALNKIGAITEWFNPLAISSELLKKYIMQSKVKYIFAVDVVYDMVRKAIKGTGIECVIVNSVLDSFPVGMRILYDVQVFGINHLISTNIFKKYAENKEIISGSKNAGSFKPGFLGNAADKILGYAQKKNIGMKASFYIDDNRKDCFISWTDFIDRYYRRGKMIKRNYEEGKISFIVHTGGTTGPIKRVAHTDYAINSAVYQAALLDIGLREGMSSLHIIPPIVALGLENTHLERYYNMHTHLICTYDRNEFVPLIKKRKPNLLVCVPSFTAQISDENIQLKHKDSLKHVSVILQGGEGFAVNADREVDKTLKRHGADITSRIGFGQNEEFGAFTFALHKNAREKKYGSCGVPLPGNEILIYDLENECELPYGKGADGNYANGEIFVRGATLMSGYYGDDSIENEKSFKIINGARFFDTGDQGYIDECGNLYWVTRKCRIIRTQNGKIFTSVLENILYGFEEVSECCVVPMPSPKIVKEASCHIVLKPKYADMNHEQYYKVARSIVDRMEAQTKAMYTYYVPGAYEFRTEKLPRTPFGKIDFVALENENIKVYEENGSRQLEKIRIRE